MTTTRIPSGIWSWKSSVLVLLLVLAPIAGLAFIAVQEHTLIDAARVEGVITAPTTLVAALALYVAWRLTQDPALAWVSLAFTVLACQVVITTGLQLLTTVDTNEGWATFADLAILEVMMVCAALAIRFRLSVDPARLGFLIGIGLAPPRLITAVMLPDLDLGTSWVEPALTFGILITATCVFILNIGGLPGWLRVRLALTVVLISSANLAMVGSGHVAAIATIACDALGAVALASTALATLKQASATYELRRLDLARRLEDAEATSRVERARMHEINATLAGIASASRLIAAREVVSETRRAELEEMMQAELERLQRLLDAPAPVAHHDEDDLETELDDELDDLLDGAPGDASQLTVSDVDATIHRLALAHEVRGNVVDWQPSGQRVAADPDVVTEVVNILLDNAAKHGSSNAEVEVEVVGDAIEISVSDSGPGVAPEMRSRIFEWGGRGQRSNGKGIGLHIARQLAQEQGGYLVLRDDPRQRTTFVVGLRAARDGVAGDDHGAAANFA